MKHSLIPLLALVISSATGAADNPEEAFLARTHSDFQERINLLADTALTNFFATPLAPETRQAMEFLYAYMPLPDIANQDAAYYQRNVEAALRARREMPWGQLVPEREFRHFVLPPRVNNEALDDSRLIFYAELAPRIKSLSMKDAILEVNHWCHEKVTYQPSDARTSSPLSAVSQAIGRCGEESTFAVAALRSVGIPARQVYTPRWAHTDDNHAWVEAWADGQWWFLGACEPEPILNLAWFNAPASRGMLMNTRAFGRYDGPEEQIARDKVYTNINVTANYAQVAPVRVKVVDAKGRPVPDADVSFCVYNYAEYYPVTRKRADREGLAELTCGRGDLVVWAADKGRFGLARANSSMMQPVKVVLDKDAAFAGQLDFEITPPPVNASLPHPTVDQVAENERRKAIEDSIRLAYTSTFATPEKARLLAVELGLDSDLLAKVLTESRGNHVRLEAMLRSVEGFKRKRALDMLAAMSEKDRRDVPVAVILERLDLPGSQSPLYNDYILNPRVENESLRPFVAEFNPPADFSAYPKGWEHWVADNIDIDSVWNPGRLRMDPAAVWRTRRADPLSRNIFFVWGARAQGIPARIDPVTGKPQWHDGTEWMEAFRPAETGAKAPMGKVEFSYVPVGRTLDPAYYSNFSISKITDGVPRLLDFDENATLSSLPTDFEAGQYVLTTGQRMADGSVLARSEFFTVPEGKSVKVPVVIRQSSKDVQVVGNFNSENRYIDTEGNQRSLLSTTGRGYYTLIYARPNHEPTAHVLNEICALAPQFEADGRKIMLIYPDAGVLARAQVASRFPGLPGNVAVGSDIDGAIARELVDNLNLLPGDAPIVVIADTFNRVVYVSQGYTINSTAHLLDILSRVE